MLIPPSTTPTPISLGYHGDGAMLLQKQIDEKRRMPQGYQPGVEKTRVRRFGRSNPLLCWLQKMQFGPFSPLSATLELSKLTIQEILFQFLAQSSYCKQVTVKMYYSGQSSVSIAVTCSTSSVIGGGGGQLVLPSKTQTWSLDFLFPLISYQLC